MDESTVRAAAEIHGRATVERDYDTAGAYLTDDVKANVGEVMRQMPRSLTAADVVSVERKGDGYSCRIRYSGDEGAMTVESRWADLEGEAKIVGLAVVERS